ncbi:uncharacterized protein LOC105784959 [Gossypium raimondii]|uniref:uncharacterized protein LOC105784959 n=1 Tax=Gossypium raimondii TaxID=29730 RepID=UPI00227AB8B9|nr:uncharacterized protein LOC105784959 [Gossypium raimondii]
MCLEGSHDFEDNEDCGLSPDLLKMVERAEKQILPHRESIEIVSLEEGKEDIPGLSTDMVVYRLPIREDCKPVQQKLRMMRPDIVLKIKEEAQKQFDAGFLQEVRYSEWVANIVPVPKKDEKVRMCMDYRDLNKASPKDNFPLPHIDTLVDNTAGFSLFSFMDGATYQKAMVALFHDMMHREIEVYVDDMIAKSRTEGEHVRVLRKLFLRLRKFQLKLNPAKCTFGARSGKLLGFIVNEKEIEIDPDKVKAIQDLPPPRTQKEVRGFLGRLNYIARFISQLTEKCDPIFRLLKKHNPGTWDEECEEAFNKVKQYLSNTPVLSPPSPDKPLILYLTVFDNSMGCVLGQHDETGRKERAILLSEFDIVYVSQKAVKGSTIADFLASRALEDYEPLSFDFPNEDLMCIAATEENLQESHGWRLNFDGASNAVGNRIGAVLVSRNGDHYPFTCKLDFDCTNNMTEYEACIMGIRAAIERGIKVLEVYGDSALVIYQLRGEWETRDPKLISYRKHGDMKPIQISIYEDPAHCYNIEEGEIDDSPWYQDILRRGKDQVLLRYVDAVEAKKILEEVHEGICGTHASGFTMARQIMRFGTSTGATPFSLVYGMEAVLPIEVEIPSLRVLTELQLDEAEWVQSRYDQLNLIEGKRLKAIQHGQMYQKRMMRAYNKKAFSGGALILAEMDGKNLPNPVNSDSVKRYFT